MLDSTIFYLNACGIVCALGDSHAQIKARLFAGESGVAHQANQCYPRRATALYVSDSLDTSRTQPYRKRYVFWQS